MKNFKIIAGIFLMGLLVFASKSQSLVSVKPDTVYQGSTVWLEIKGSGTHFTDLTANNQIELRRGFGNRIYPDTFYVADNKEVQARFNIGNLNTGTYEVRVTTQTDGMMRLQYSVTVVPDPDAPAIKEVSPDTVMAGTQFKLSISGDNTQFQSGSNLTAYLLRGFGQNYQADSARASSETDMDAWFSLPYSAQTGSYQVRVSNDSDGVMNLADAVLVTANPNQPSLVSFTPSQAGQGEKVAFTVLGHNTHFLDQGGVYMMLQANQAQLTPDSVKSLTDTTFIAYFDFPISTALGFYTAQVIDQPDGQLSLSRAVEIVTSQYSPSLDSVSPAYAYPGDTFVMQIFSKNTTFTQSAALTVYFGQGFQRIQPDSVTVVNDTFLKAYYTLSTNTGLGFYPLNVTGAPEGNLTMPNAFEVRLSPTAPQIVSLQPDSAIQGTSVQVYYSCKNTSFLSETNLSASLRRGWQGNITADSTVVLNDSTLLAYFTISMNAQTGLYEGRISNVSTGTLSLPNAFEIFTSPYQPRIDKFSPLFATQGDVFTLRIYGKYTEFTKGTNQLVNLRMGFGSSFNATSTSVLSDTVIDAGFSIPANAPAGFYNITISGLDAGNMNLWQAFEIKLAPTSPQIIYVNPDEGRVGEQVNVMIYCANTTLTKDNNLQVRLSRGWGQNINASSFTVENDTLIKAIFDIPLNARTGKYNVQVQNTSAGTLNLNQGFEIKPPLTDPQLVSVTPASRKRGEAYQITIKAINTNFTAGANTIQFNLFGSNYSPSSSTVVNDTLITCIMTFPINAILGGYTVNVNNQADGRMGLQQAFQLLSYSLHPSVKSVSPDTLYNGNSFELSIETGQTKLRKANSINIWLGNGVTTINTDSFHVNHDSSLTAWITIDAHATTGAYDLYVYTDIEDTLKLQGSNTLMDTSTSIGEFSFENLRVYPNPATELIRVLLPENSTGMKAVIYNMKGQILYSAEIVQGTTVADIDISGFASGPYHVLIQGRGKVFSAGFIKD